MKISKLFKPLVVLGTTTLIALIASTQSPEVLQYQSPAVDSLYNQLTEEQKRSPKFATAGLTVEKGLQVELFASEPMLVNPTNITVDHKGRVWVCEAHNYRNEITGQKANPKGDRILVLEDTNKDGKADKSTVFYQDAELNAPIGIWVFGNKVLVSQSPYIWLITDENGDLKGDKKEIIFQGIEGVHHDHGVHAFVMGPDGRYYFNFGNEGKKLLDAKGNPLIGKDGKPIDFSKYKQGLVFRCDPDFTNFEVIGQNFRNNFEVAVDSYGNLWQSDNDDDGNRAVRINYVMEYGNYGFTNELTGAGWRAYRTNWEDSIPNRHWHLNDPGVIPNLLHTGAGSPTGIAIYEGKLLPTVYQNQMIHADAGPNVIRSYPVESVGAGYQAKIVPIVKGERDQWFRPSDVAVAPDGSLFISDWYDSGVGGHQMGDATRGRIYRVTPTGHKGYKVPVLQPYTVKGAFAALENANLEAQSLARLTLLKTEKEDYKLLLHHWQTSTDSRYRARITWVLGMHSNTDQSQFLKEVIQDQDAAIRMVGIRLARQISSPILPSLLTTLSLDQEPQVRREVAIALHDSNFDVYKKAAIWSNLAKQHNGKDRWYLEALGIGATNHWDVFFEKWLADTLHPLGSVGNQDIIWRARTTLAIPYLKTLASDQSVPLQERLRYFRAFDFVPGSTEKSTVLMEMSSSSIADSLLNKLILHHLSPAYIQESARAMALVEEQLLLAKGSKQFIDLVKKYELKNQKKELLNLVMTNGGNELGRSAMSTLLQQGGENLVEEVIARKQEAELAKIIPAIRSVGSTLSVSILENILKDQAASTGLKKQAIFALGGSMLGEDILIKNLKEGRISDELKSTSYEAVKNAWRKAVRNEVKQYVEEGVVPEQKSKHPSVSSLLTQSGNVTKGKTVFGLYCSSCHQVGDKGYDFGPKLTEIGGKLPKQGQYLAIFSPSAGISFGYEGTELSLKNGAKVTGIIVSKTSERVLMKFPGGGTQDYNLSDIKSMISLNESMMTAGLAEAMSTAQLVDLVEYLLSLKK